VKELQAAGYSVNANNLTHIAASTYPNIKI
jgi:hypothetical protein